jgi:hypothetical protein
MIIYNIVVEEMEQHALKKCKHFFTQTSGGQSYILYLNVVHFLMPVLIRLLWQLKTVVFLHRCLI